MISLNSLQNLLQNSPTSTAPPPQYRCRSPLNLYDSPLLERLATQAATGRYLQVRSLAPNGIALEVCLCEDDYPGWLDVADVTQLDLAESPYQPIARTEAEIATRLPAAIAFAQAAMQQPNEYLWGGTIGPNYDCSGLVQAAFASTGIWLPRDAYQQEAFTQSIALDAAQSGDLIFFGPPAKATHVALYLGDDRYLHSSGKDHGRNGIGLDCIGESDDPVSQWYRTQIRGVGRVVAAYLGGSCGTGI